MFSIDDCNFCFQIICIDELKTDYKNPISQCDNLNQLVLPEYGIQAVLYASLHDNASTIRDRLERATTCLSHSSVRSVFNIAILKIGLAIARVFAATSSGRL